MRFGRRGALMIGAGLLLGVAALTLLGWFLNFSTTTKVSGQAGVPTPASVHGTRKPPPARPPLIDPSAPPTASAAQARLSRALTKQLAAGGPETGALVYDLGTGSVLFALRPTVERPPASVEKLWTTTTLLTTMGPDARLHTSVLGTGTMRDGVWEGNLYLRGGGDPTFGDSGFVATFDHGNGSTADELVAALRRTGLRRVTGHVYGDESLFDTLRGGLLTGYAPDVPDYLGQLSALSYDHGGIAPGLSPATFATREVVSTMQQAGIQATAANHTAVTPAHAQLLATVNSPPMITMIHQMDVYSDDLYAELFTKQLGARYGAAGSIAAGAKVIARTIVARYDLYPTILDGSGLSHQDGSSPLQIVELLRDLWGTPVGDELAASLPTVGVNGTTATIAVHTPAQRNCIAKTGTLTGVTSLAGYCHSATHQELAFALLVDGPSNQQALPLLSQMVAAIARY